ncbi:MAG: M90 family metallopeptidase [Sulfuricaulis sp.]|uniref:M90 family metallopeptidase n=1 Tax=Sulfuricaulis sp. TaxID=2003553 RepID=UPI003C43D8FF
MTAPRKASPRRAGQTTGSLKRLLGLRRSGRDSISDATWSRSLRTSPYARSLSGPDRERLRELANLLLREKSFSGAAGLVVTNAMRARIALHACLPILNLGLDYYTDWSSIVIYPGDFRVHDEYMDEHGVVHREIMDLCGQSLSHGPMVLSWEAIRVEDSTQGDYNLVIHECAHKLDVLNGDANGFPPLHADMDGREWARDFQDAYDRFCAALKTSDGNSIDPYASEDPAEFFAVASETFFTVPDLINAKFPAVYSQLQRFYRQDPCRQLSRESS